MADCGDVEPGVGVPPKWLEVPQRGLYSLEKRGSVFSVTHRVTWETKKLPEGHDWHLLTALDTNRVYAASDKGLSMWMSSFLRTSMWAIDGRVLVHQSASDGEVETKRWLDDVPRYHKCDWVDVVVREGNFVIGRAQANIYIWDTLREGSAVFWEVDSFRDRIGCGTKNCSKVVQ